MNDVCQPWSQSPTCTPERKIKDGGANPEIVHQIHGYGTVHSSKY